MQASRAVTVENAVYSAVYTYVLKYTDFQYIQYFFLKSKTSSKCSRCECQPGQQQALRKAAKQFLETAEESQILSPGAELPPHLLRHNWCVTQSCRCCDDFATRVTRGTRHAAASVVAAARSTRSTRFMLHVLHVTVAVLGGLVCAQSRRALFARDGSSERIHILRRRR